MLYANYWEAINRSTHDNMPLDGTEINKRSTQKRRQIREARLQIVSELRLQGKSVRQIADAVTARLQLKKKVSTGTIHNDLKLLLQQWREDNNQNTEEWVQLEVARVDMLIAELYEAWEKSKKDYERTRASQERRQLEITDKEAEGNKPKAKATKHPASFLKQSQSRENVINYGNVGYISEIRKLLEYRAKLLGLYAPDRKEVTGANGQPLNPTTTNTTITVEELTDDELATLYAIAAKRDKKAQ